ncbi:glycosyltransferase family 2 protein [Brevundimonas subvibrioides]|uniref:glycosyltransferase family 2 protein n=1 Tax=Brevundimonas subvibrioides TaxID=74313 RepID=UPI0032D5A16A
MTCYNEGAYIEEAVRSVLQQTLADRIESIVIADDGSNATTIAVLKTIEGWDRRIRILYGPGGVGLPGQRNIAASHITAPIVAILDGDDLWTADKLERQLPAFADPGVGLVYSDYFSFADGSMDKALRAGVLDVSGASDLARSYFLNDPPIIPSTALIRRDAFDRAGGFDASVKVFEDTDFYMRLAGVCRFALVDTPVLYKRLRPTSITGGRNDLMAHHAFVALKAAAARPDLLSLVPRRLGERARKLGNQRYLSGDRAGATRLLRFATQMDAWNIKAWGSLAIAMAGHGIVGRWLAPRLARRRQMMGIEPS